MDILESNKFKISVSSVLNKDVKQHGKQFMLDAEDDTAWSSNEGKPQWISLKFDEAQTISGFSLQFQGGFVGINARVKIEADDGRVVADEPFYPEDINSVQVFQLSQKIQEKVATRIKFLFEESTDFFGRMIVYKLKIFG